MIRLLLVEPRWLTEIKRNGEYDGKEGTRVLHLLTDGIVERTLPPMPMRDVFVHELRLRGRTVRYDAKERVLVIE